VTEVGWKFVTWTGQPVTCAVPSCNALIYSGHVRVDRQRPQDGDPCICNDCHFHIMAGIDPDADAVTPEWELANREQRLREAMDG
jgi:hypothetical protein